MKQLFDNMEALGAIGKIRKRRRHATPPPPMDAWATLEIGGKKGDLDWPPISPTHQLK